MGLIVKAIKKPQSPQNILYCVTTSTRQWKRVCRVEMHWVSAATGARKSLTFELFQHAFDCLNGENSCNSNSSVLLHAVLLILLIQDQVLNLNSPGISAS